MSRVVVRKMREGDLPRAMAILRRWNMAPVAASRRIPRPERTGIEIANSFVAILGSRLVGVASYIVRGPREAETASLAVAPGMRGMGIGKRLHRARLAELKRRGIERLRTEADRPATIRWYQQFGHRVVGTKRKRHAFGLRSVDRWTVLELDLGTPQAIDRHAGRKGA